LGNGYLDQYDFNLKPTGQHKDAKYKLPEGKEPTWNTDKGHNMTG
jgi:hypothetical protein